jgi:hypothetical protein
MRNDRAGGAVEEGRFYGPGTRNCTLFVPTCTLTYNSWRWRDRKLYCLRRKKQRDCVGKEQSGIEGGTRTEHDEYVISLRQYLHKRLRLH